MARFFELRNELERLFGRPVDLVMANAPRTPSFLREVNRTRQQLTNLCEALELYFEPRITCIEVDVDAA